MQRLNGTLQPQVAYAAPTGPVPRIPQQTRTDTPLQPVPEEDQPSVAPSPPSSLPSLNVTFGVLIAAFALLITISAAICIVTLTARHSHTPEVAGKAVDDSSADARFGRPLSSVLWGDASASASTPFSHAPRGQPWAAPRSSLDVHRDPLTRTEDDPLLPHPTGGMLSVGLRSGVDNSLVPPAAPPVSLAPRFRCRLRRLCMPPSAPPHPLFGGVAPHSMRSCIALSFNATFCPQSMPAMHAHSVSSADAGPPSGRAAHPGRQRRGGLQLRRGCVQSQGSKAAAGFNSDSRVRVGTGLTSTASMSASQQDSASTREHLGDPLEGAAEVLIAAPPRDAPADEQLAFLQQQLDSIAPDVVAFNRFKLSGRSDRTQGGAPPPVLHPPHVHRTDNRCRADAPRRAPHRALCGLSAYACIAKPGLLQPSHPHRRRTTHAPPQLQPYRPAAASAV